MARAMRCTQIIDLDKSDPGKRFLVNLEADVPSVSTETDWSKTGDRNAVHRFACDADEAADYEVGRRYSVKISGPERA